MCVNNYKSCLTGYITLWNLLCSLTLKMFISLQLGGSIWYHLIWIGNSRNINKIIYPNLLPLTSERVLFTPCWYGIGFFFILFGSQLLRHSFPGFCTCNWPNREHIQFLAEEVLIMEWFCISDYFVVDVLNSCPTLRSFFLDKPHHKIWWSCFLKHAFLVQCCEYLPTRPQDPCVFG